MTDPLLQLLDGLPSARLDPSRGDRIRARCHAALVLGRRSAERKAAANDDVRTLLVPLAAGLQSSWVSAAWYLGAVLQQVLALYGLV